jgi:hypothetical protein
MLGVELFLGFPVDPTFTKELSQIDPQLVALFIQNDDNYLKEIVYHDVRYLGKFAGKISDTSDLKLLEANIYSLLKKMIPDYPYENVPLVLFPAAIATIASPS